MKLIISVILSLTCLFATVSWADTSVQTHSTIVSAIPTTAATPAAYAAGDVVGTKLSFTGAVRGAVGGETPAFTGLVTQVTMTDLGAEGKNMELVLFCQDPSGTTFTDNGALDIADADLVKVCGSALVNSHSAFADNGFSQAQNLAIPIDLSSSGATTLYGALVAREAVTLDADGVLKVFVGIVQD